MQREKPKSGDKYGRLTLIAPVGIAKNRDSIWLCSCECGGRKRCRVGRLRDGTTRSCGCLYRETRAAAGSHHNKPNRLPPGAEAANHAFRSLRGNAKARGIGVEITLRDYLEVAQRPCYYCGQSLTNEMPDQHGAGSFRYTGVDRKDNSLPYTVENIVPCCINCNSQKGASPAVDFVARCVRIAELHGHKNPAGKLATVLVQVLDASRVPPMLEKIARAALAEWERSQ